MTNKYNELHQKYPLNLYLGCEKNRKVPYRDLNNVIENFARLLGDDVYNMFTNMIKNDGIDISITSKNIYIKINKVNNIINQAHL